MIKVLKSFTSAYDAVNWMTQNRMDDTSIEMTGTLKSMGMGPVPSGNYHVVLKSENNKPLKNPIKKGAEVNFMYGYPVITNPKDHISADVDKMFQEDKENLAAAATGQLDGEENEGRAIVINPYHPYFNPDDPSHEERIKNLARLEASRHVMDEINFKPNFEISQELQNLREKVFSKNKQGKYYLNNDDSFRKTIISRLVAGDKYLGKHDEIPVNDSLQKEVNFIFKQMNERKEKYGDKPSEEYLGYLHQNFQTSTGKNPQQAADDAVDNIKSIVNEIVLSVLKSLKSG